MGTQQVIIGVIWILSTLAGMAIARAKNRRGWGWEGLVLGGLLGIIGVGIIAVQKAAEVGTVDEHGEPATARPGRLDWLTGGPAATASTPAIMLAAAASAAVVFFVYQLAAGNYA